MPLGVGGYEMSAEINLEFEGDRLAESAIDNGIKSTQLRTLYEKARSKPMEDLKSYVEYQMSRITGYWSFGQVMLELIKKYWESKTDLVKVLEFANMKYDFKRLKRIEDIIKAKTSQYGFKGVDFVIERTSLKEVRVFLRDFKGSPHTLSEEIIRKIMQNVTSMPRFRVRIQMERR